MHASPSPGAVRLDLTLRATTLRGLDGTMWHVPNGEIRRAGNKSQYWARVILDVPVAYDADIVAVSSLIKQTIDSAHQKGKWVGMCGELAGMPKAIPILLGMGLDEFSMASRSVPLAKHLIRKLSDAQAAQIAEHALSMSSAIDIEEYMKTILAELGI